MAFNSKIGNLLKQTVNKHIKTELSASNPLLFQAIRCMSSSKIFLGGLSYSTDDTSLREACSSYGEVIEARVILDRETGRSRGFGFVTFTSGEEASAAISALDGKDLHGRMVRVNYATDRAVVVTVVMPTEAVVVVEVMVMVLVGGVLVLLAAAMTAGVLLLTMMHLLAVAASAITAVVREWTMVLVFLFPISKAAWTTLWAIHWKVITGMTMTSPTTMPTRGVDECMNLREKLLKTAIYMQTSK
ncbi:hypothetical protein AAC387_Pa05g1625 [Persea americana]